MVRLNMWNFAIQQISIRPLLGFGSTSFSDLLYLNTGYWRAHAHNLPIELAISFGIPAALSVILPVLLIVLKTINKTLEVFMRHDSR